MVLRSIWILLLVLFLFDCSNAKKDQIRTLKEELFVIHDEVMPRMGEMMKLKDQLSILSDSIGQFDSLKALDLKEAAGELKLAYDGMNSWMHDFEVEHPNEIDEKVLAYFRTEKEKITKVKDDMLGSIKRAKELIKENK